MHQKRKEDEKIIRPSTKALQVFCSNHAGELHMINYKRKENKVLKANTQPTTTHDTPQHNAMSP